MGVRLNTYLDSIGPVWSAHLLALDSTGPSSAVIERRGTVQKLTAVHPETIHSKRRRLPSHGPLPRSGRLQLFVDLLLGRMLQNHSMTFRGYVEAKDVVDLCLSLLPFLNEGNRRVRNQSRLPRPFCRSEHESRRLTAVSIGYRHLAAAPNRSRRNAGLPNAGRSARSTRN